MTRVIEEALARCAARPEWKEMIFSKSFRRSQYLFREPVPPEVTKHVQTRHWALANGSTIHFGYVDLDRDVERYQGCQWRYTIFEDYLGARNEAWLRTRERL